jgi:N-acetyltransferase
MSQSARQRNGRCPPRFRGARRAKQTGNSDDYRSRMPRPLEPVTLTGRHVRLEPLTLEHTEELVVAANADRSTFDLTPVPDSIATMKAYIEHALAGHERCELLPFAQVAVASGTVVGSTRLLDLQWRRARDHPDEVEIGSTWLSASAQRSGINTEAKHLLLQYAFEDLGVWRVAICTDARNDRSRRAIERIGATYEGVLRNYRVRYDTPSPSPRDTAVYSIIADEWPTVSARLREKLDR